ncbi:MAG: polyphosphate:AMP phosphotransferase [Proteobacteria bacterium]|nr:polyphosphate:AMP phosphotransferase [Pseudomonadota bacterium]HQR03091.1 polyphosphate:AMP phosphotransferase [Rhodocyclaceae bacterium]
MFESAELEHTVDKKTYVKQETQLRADLLDAQYDLWQAVRFPVVVLFNGLDGAGKGEMVNLLNAWMDPRHIETHAFPPPSEEERERPGMWRFWRALPAKGKIGIFVGNWYTDPIVGRVRDVIGAPALAQSVDDILCFERMLTDEGVLVLKYWFHLSKKGQMKRLRMLEKDPRTRWRVTPHDWALYAEYDRYIGVAEPVLRRTSTGNAPWTVVDGSDARCRALTVGQHLLANIRKHLDAPPGDPHRPATAPPLIRAIDNRNLLNTLDMGQKLPRSQYREQLEAQQARLNQLSRHPAFRKHSVFLVFEGNDAAGKGGTIRRVTAALDARDYRIIPIAAPTEEERAQPYLWRFWRHVPRRHRMVIFDRSWYGRVLVERVEGYCSEADWMRAYSEINDFEEQLVRHGAIVLKFWLAISAEEQLRRFKERENTRFKRFKITEEDWRNRDKWPLYEQAVCDMVDRTSTEIAPWHLIAANDKNLARIRVLRTVADQMEATFRKKKHQA